MFKSNYVATACSVSLRHHRLLLELPRDQIVQRVRHPIGERCIGVMSAVEQFEIANGLVAGVSMQCRIARGT